jgi:hypothetical protein
VQIMQPQLCHGNFFLDMAELSFQPSQRFVAFRTPKAAAHVGNPAAMMGKGHRFQAWRPDECDDYSNLLPQQKTVSDHDPQNPLLFFLLFVHGSEIKGTN